MAEDAKVPAHDAAPEPMEDAKVPAHEAEPSVESLEPECLMTNFEAELSVESSEPECLMTMKPMELTKALEPAKASELKSLMTKKRVEVMEPWSSPSEQQLKDEVDETDELA